MKLIEYYQLIHEVVVIANFEQEMHATMAGKVLSGYKIIPVRLNICESMGDYDPDVEIREAALAKLTDEERRVLRL